MCASADNLYAGCMERCCQHVKPQLQPREQSVTRLRDCMLQGLHQWEQSTAPFSQPITQEQPVQAGYGSQGMSALLATLACAKRGLLVVAELTSTQDVVAALSISKALGWPLVADALSGNSCNHYHLMLVLCLAVHLTPKQMAASVATVTNGCCCSMHATRVDVHISASAACEMLDLTQ